MELLWKPTLLVPLISLGCHSSQGGRGASEVVIDSQSTVQATYGMPLELPIDATGGTPPYHFSVEDPQNLPQGLHIDAQSGEITGAPERMGDFRFRVRVEDSSVRPHRKDRIISLQVGPPVFSTLGRQILLNGKQSITAPSSPETPHLPKK